MVKAFWQTAQRKGLSPVCVRIWICRAEDEEKFFRQTPHKCLDDAGGGGCVGPLGTVEKKTQIKLNETSHAACYMAQFMHYGFLDFKR